MPFFFTFTETKVLFYTMKSVTRLREIYYTEGLSSTFIGQQETAVQA